jgi:hypothetical protein
VTFAPAQRPKNDRRPEVALARGAGPIQDFLVWSRFPYWTVTRTPTGAHVEAADMRFPDAEGARGANFRGDAIIRP